MRALACCLMASRMTAPMVVPLLADAWFAATSRGEAATAPAGSASTCATALSSANGSPARPAHLRTFAAGLR